MRAFLKAEMNTELAKAELLERTADLICCLRIEESARRCVSYFERVLEAVGATRAPVLLRCLARDRLAGRMAIARSYRFSAAVSERLRSLVDLAEGMLTGLEVPFDVSWGEGDLIDLEPDFELPFEGIGESERRLVHRLYPAKAQELFELTTLWCLSSVNGLVIRQDLFDVKYWSLELGSQGGADATARAVVHDSTNWAVYLGENDSFALPQSLLRRFTHEILLQSAPDRPIVISLPLEWVFIQFEGILGVGRPRPGVSFGRADSELAILARGCGCGKGGSETDLERPAGTVGESLAQLWCAALSVALDQSPARGADPEFRLCLDDD